MSQPKHSAFQSTVPAHVRSAAGVRPATATDRKFWSGLSSAVMAQIADNWEATRTAYAATRQQHYFSAEFLQGRALLNNLTNLGLVDEAKAAAKQGGRELTDVLEAEHDAALGNGGLGRLAACFLDSAVTQDYPVTGYGLLYRYGLFRQSFENGHQKEEPDAWMENGYEFVIRRASEQRRVHFDDMDVRAIPYDMPITGYGTDNVGTLRLWKSEPIDEFDYDAFNSQRFTDAIVERERVMDICRVLYPNDTTYEGKVLRVRQQYFFVSASLQAMIDNYIEHHGSDLRGFAKYNSIQLNDTHPVLAIPELLRLLLDEHDLSWDDAWKVVTETFAYTNHTVLAEALESWEVSIFQKLFWRIWELVEEIDRRFRQDMATRGLDQGRIDYMAPVSNGQVHMAWIACYAAYSINGVAALHTEIIKADTLSEWHELWPEKFNNKTNGVTPRRWLKMCNPRLAKLLTKQSGSDEWVTDLTKLAELAELAENEKVLRKLMEIKHKNKVDFAQWVKEHQGAEVDPDSIFDVQIKRLHEYKRQLMNALYILDLYFRIKEDGESVPKRTFIFGAKAAPGYVRAKEIIKLINTIAELVNNDEDTRDIIRVVFVENYNVSPAEHIIPAADVSEQISVAGKEASGTSNMKFMMNGALTLGTMDGANVEIVEAVGEDNAYIFGARNEEIPSLRESYNPGELYNTVRGLKRVLDALNNGTLGHENSGMFGDLRSSLLDGQGVHAQDTYYVLGDFESYREARDRMANDYVAAPLDWAKKAWLNICLSGRFSSDRTIADYANEVWKLNPAPINR
ncbi:TPA: glycogen/starch/alpha-glucan phosphorylase [Corynebacterium striatum]|uniref:Alpha-1,4 glucan phosphorylase n=1 Tax=Corynebacterium striatum TaxID=43770 RepID=A0ABC8CKF2_CORST|nr:glycogen/starch/alpha-glucan phosphorylase [Corynebacterium striatum]ATZ08177.1 glycogen phosphorylase [Corynebacterium striatum]EGT5593426.1 glycogen/starch/alpha-glucan family phosphorylase [Corynebacterium striatum]EGT5612680.1 glycogen/starch/alpha-glucan family phosphorylase [Corynebacterium striatum]MDK8807873.1 glycogen/starch/alpha-glucan phosphorylase [Corynebacterium striatum]MDK8880689.1 glycogen/starch/alpha-glucan phosphorylase [Corynebacterium striatum]